MRLAVNTLLWSVEFTPADLSLLPRLKERGFEGVEIPVFNPSALEAAKIRKGFESNGLECIVCSVIPNGLSLISDDAAARAKGQQHLRHVIEIADEVGARIVAGRG